jgi:hypothetical protein
MPHYRLWSCGLAWSLSGYVAVGAISLLVALRVAGALFRSAKGDWHEEGQRGSVVMQFTLLSPLLFALLLVIFQTALIVQAKLVVNYAAFCAARSAVAMIPAAVRAAVSGHAENEGQINPQDPASPKMAIITRAGALACAGISPRWNADLALATGVLPSFSSGAKLAEIGLVFTPLQVPAAMNRATFAADFASRAQYALNGENTTVQLSTERHPGSDDKASYQMVTVTLSYRYYLTVPFANRIFGTRFPGILSAYYLPAKEQYTLLAEDDPTFPPGQQQNLFVTDNYQ